MLLSTRVLRSPGRTRPERDNPIRIRWIGSYSESYEIHSEDSLLRGLGDAHIVLVGFSDEQPRIIASCRARITNERSEIFREE